MRPIVWKPVTSMSTSRPMGTAVSDRRRDGGPSAQGCPSGQTDGKVELAQAIPIVIGREAWV